MVFDQNVMLMVAPLLLLLAGLAFTVMIDPYLQKIHRTILLVIAGLCLSLVAQNLWGYELQVGTPRILARTLNSAYGYAVRPVVLILFLYIVKPEGRYRLWWSLAGINAAVYFSAPFFHLSFWIGDSNEFYRGPLSWFCLAISAVLLADLVIQTLKIARANGKRETWIPILVAVSIVGSVFLDYRAPMDGPITFLTIAMIVGSVFFYIWLHFPFVRAHERDLIAEQRIKIMISQIQPHFLFNTIATFKALCRQDPDKAAGLAEKFAVFLRQNLDSLESADLIPFEKELDHTRLYAEIEMTRFDNIRVEYDIQDTDFKLPALTVQPMVENAIRHGVRAREEGRVLVASHLRNGWHEVVIEDNGIGFDEKKMDSTKGSHIGIRNVRERIEKMCGGTFVIKSNVDEGTKVTIRIPQGEEKE